MSYPISAFKDLSNLFLGPELVLNLLEQGAKIFKISFEAVLGVKLKAGESSLRDNHIGK